MNRWPGAAGPARKPGWYAVNPYIVLGSAVVGLLVGLTGAGGGALMTPMLILLFNVKPEAAISSDLVAAARPPLLARRAPTIASFGRRSEPGESIYSRLTCSKTASSHRRRSPA